MFGLLCARMQTSTCHSDSIALLQAWQSTPERPTDSLGAPEHLQQETAILADIHGDQAVQQACGSLHRCPGRLRARSLGRSHRNLTIVRCVAHTLVRCLRRN